MTEIINWIKEILMILVTLSFLQFLIPDSSMAKFLRFIYSLVILAVILNPVISMAERLGILT